MGSGPRMRLEVLVGLLLVCDALAAPLHSWTDMLADKKAAPKKQPAIWGYETVNGPKTWSKTFPKCAGVQQSPIDIVTKKAVKGLSSQPVQPHILPCEKNTLTVENDGNTVKVQSKGFHGGLKGSTTLLNGEEWSLQQFHFHHTSENTVNGKALPLETQFVHKNKRGKIMVLSLLWTEGKADNPQIKILNWAAVKEKKIVTLNAALLPHTMLPTTMEYYYYTGSLTIPPCTEGVTWVILKNMATLSKAQIASFPFKNNFRPPQPLNSRKVLYGSTGESLARKMGYINPDDPNGYGPEGIMPF